MNDRDLHARASELFVALRELRGPERAAALERAAREDPRLSAEVASLLEHDAEDENPAQLDGRSSSASVDEPLSLASLDERTSSPSLDEPTSSAPAELERIGPYRLLRRIGRGSSGQVFLAEQKEPIHRRVAIKIVPQAALHRELAARFEVERRALETTEHPNIARILDAGRTEGGLPYLVMEYVEGPPITAYCDRERLPLLERIRLFLDVADAVQHAHQRGVIHRDLKPANVLVARVEDRAIPVVLDFGIAKPVSGTFPEETPPTSGLPIGTPSYMAPEQTGLTPVDTRADVYSLGALLYELVAGEPPIDGSGDPLDALQRIRDQVPRPASRVRAASRDPALGDRVPASILADLDALLGKALEKPRDLRYPTVAAFAEDLRRILRREPIAARPPTRRYRTARFVQRNRVLVAAGSFVLLALIVGVAGLSIGIVHANRERREAVLQSESQREINRFLTEDLLAQASPDRQGPEARVLDLLHRASRTIDERFPTRPLVAASVHQTLGDAYAELGEFDDAERHVARALELRTLHAGADAPETVRSAIASATLLARRERFAEAEGALRTAVERARTILGPDDRDLYTALNDLGVTLDSLGRAGEAIPYLVEALAGRRRVLDPFDRDVLATLSNLALALDTAGDTQRSLAMLLEALHQAESSPDPPRYTLLGLANNIAAIYQDLGRDREAEPYLLRAADMAARMLGPEHPATSTIETNLASLRARLGDTAGALELYRRVVASRTAALGADAQDTLVARHGYWEAVRMECRPDEAAAGFALLQEDVDRTLGEDQLLSAQTGLSLARALLECGRSEEALPPAEKAEAKLTALFGEDHFRTRGAHALVARLRAGGPAEDGPGLATVPLPNAKQ